MLAAAFRTDLRRGFLLWLAAALALSSVAFGTLFVALYRSQLEQEREQALLEMNRLLQSSLENAMLKADLDGLRDIVDRLGAQSGMRGAMIVNPSRQVRFASDPARLGQVVPPAELGLCRECGQTPVRQMEPTSVMLTTGQGDTLRSVNPVPNQAKCERCHGPAEVQPINGLLVVDYDATPLRESARKTAALFLGAGLGVILLTLASGWWFIQRRVLQPIRALNAASHRLAAGELDARVSVSGVDEFSRLGDSFNEMAASLKASLQALENRKAFLQSLVDAVPDGIRVIDRDHNMVLVNAAFERMHGLERGEAAGKKCYAMSHRKQEPCPAALQTCPLHELREKDETLRIVARHARDAQGTAVDVEVFAAVLSGLKDSEQGPWVIESIRDLEQDVRYSQEQRLSELGRLATGVAHEIYNPLAAIRIALHALRRTTERQNYHPNEIGEYLSIVDSEIDRCVQVTEHLLKLAMPSSKRQLVDVNCAVHETMALLKWEAQERHVEIVERLSDRQPRIMLTDGDMRMIVLNLAQNAFHAMPGGGRLEVSTDCQDGDVLVRVKDNGIGITPEDRRRIFEPFFSRRADGGRGTGIGLSIVRGIIATANGRIAVSSAPGAGACFTISLPAAPETVSAS